MPQPDAVCPPGTPFAAAADSLRDGTATAEDAAGRLAAQLTDDELLGLLDGDSTLGEMIREFRRSRGSFPRLTAGRVDRLGIPGFRFTDGPRGIGVGRCTSFPVAIARAATWDPDLERLVGDAIGREGRAEGRNQYGGICVNVTYAPGWGRSQESYGDDPVLLGAMGAALHDGVAPWMMTTVKHFAVNSMEEARFRVDVTVAEDVLREVYLPHFQDVVDAGADVVMAAYNAVNGEWCGQHRHLLTEILRDEWGFEGTVQTDWIWGLRDPVGSVAAGMDVEMPIRQQRARALPGALRDGRLDRGDVLRAATRILATQLRFAVRARPAPSPDVIASDEHRALAREVAARSVVLLRNQAVDGAAALPLDPGSVGGVAVLGRLANASNQGDVGSSKVTPPSRPVSILAGLRDRLGDRVVHVGEDLQASVHAARSADAAVIVVGLSSVDEGESLLGLDPASIALFGGIARFRPIAWLFGRLGRVAARFAGWGGDRRDLGLHTEDVALIEAVAAVNPRTIVVVIAGGAVVLHPWDEQVAAILFAWYPGMEGGHAVADVILGDREPAGRLPFVIPRRKEDLPVLDWDADRVTYDRWWGQRRLDRDGIPAAYPLGFGLGWTDFSLSDLELGPIAGDAFTATVSVTNAGSRPGRHVVQLYAQLPGHERPVRALVGFQTIAVAAGETERVTIVGSTRPLRQWRQDGFQLPSASVTVEAGAHAGDPAAVTGVLDGLG